MPIDRVSYAVHVAGDGFGEFRILDGHPREILEACPMRLPEARIGRWRRVTASPRVGTRSDGRGLHSLPRPGVLASLESMPAPTATREPHARLPARTHPRPPRSPRHGPELDERAVHCDTLGLLQTQQRRISLGSVTTDAGIEASIPTSTRIPSHRSPRGLIEPITIPSQSHAPSTANVRYPTNEVSPGGRPDEPTAELSGCDAFRVAAHACRLHARHHHRNALTSAAIALYLVLSDVSCRYVRLQLKLDGVWTGAACHKGSAARLRRLGRTPTRGVEKEDRRCWSFEYFARSSL
jgi:hypothetical protein